MNSLSSLLSIRKLSLGFVVLVALLSALGIARLAPYMSPVREGNSHAFWMAATGVKLTPEVPDRTGDTYFVDDDWVAYDLWHFHGSDIYRVPVNEVLADFPSVIAELEKSAGGEEKSFTIQGYLNWRDNPKLPRTAYALHTSIQEERLRDRMRQGPKYAYYLATSEFFFWRRWNRIPYYWANYAFEWTFLTGLALFLVWPLMRNHPRWRIALHRALIPLLFFIPAYLGYASFSLTSAGPSGGILYPFLLIYFGRWGFVTTWDSWTLSRMPPLLEPISTPIGAPMALTGKGSTGPTCAILFGLAAAAAILAARWLYTQWNKTQRLEATK